MSSLSLALFFFFFSFNQNVEAGSVISFLVNVLQSVTNTAKLPIKSPLPPLGTTSCSTYPHADKGVVNFQQLCYTQRYLQWDPTFSYKCRKTKFTVGLPLAEVPFEIPQVVGFTPQAGYVYSDFVSVTNSSLHFTYNATFVEAQTAEQTYFFTNAANLTVINTGVITTYTDKGYVYLICPVDNLSKALCASPTFVFVCTYAQFPPDADVQALIQPLIQYPYYFGKNFVVMNQTGC